MRTRQGDRDEREHPAVAVLPCEDIDDDPRLGFHNVDGNTVCLSIFAVWR